MFWDESQNGLERSKNALRARIDYCLETACRYEDLAEDPRLANVYLWNALKWEERLQALEEDK